MAHAQKPDFVCQRNERVHLNRRGRQFSRLLAAVVCVSAVVMLDTTCSEVVWRVLATHSIRPFPLHFPSRASPCAIRFQMHSTALSVILRVRHRCTLKLRYISISFPEDGDSGFLRNISTYPPTYKACSKKDRTFVIKTLFYNILSTAPFKLVPPTGNTPFPKFLPFLESFLERTFCDGAQFSYSIFLNLRVFKRNRTF